MLAILSGVLGNAAYDVVKALVRRIVEQKASVTKLRSDQELLDLEPEAIDELIRLTKEHFETVAPYEERIRAAIVEEILADSVVHTPILAAKMLKAMTENGDETEANRREFVKLMGKAIDERTKRDAACARKFKDRWKKIS